MLARQTLPRLRAAGRAAPDMALASTIVFFGVFPAVLGAGLVLVQVIAAVAP